MQKSDITNAKDSITMEMFALILGSLPSLTMEQMLILVIFAVIGFAGFALHVFHSIAKK